WETATGKPLGPALAHQGGVVAVAFSPDGKTALTASLDHTARLWEVATGRQLGPALQHDDGVRAAAFSPDGKLVLTGSDDKTARLWETATGKPLGPPLQHRTPVPTVAFSQDGKAFLTGSEGTARLWRLPKPMQREAKHILLWAQVITGAEFDEYGALRVLDGAAWQECRKRLQEAGGPPED